MSEFTCIGPDCKFDRDRNSAHMLHHIKQHIKTKITHDDLSLLPTREDFLEPKLKEAFRIHIAGGKPIMFLPNDIVEKNDFVDGVMTYRVYMFGIIPDGSKTCVILEDVPVHLDIKVPTDQTPDQFDDMIRGQFITKDIRFVSITDIMQFGLHGFQKQKSPYKRIFFNNLQDRKKAIEFVTALNRTLKQSGKPKLETAADDTGRDNYYFPKIARERKFKTADWNRFEKYTAVEASRYTTNCSYVFKVSLDEFKKLDKKRKGEILGNPKHPLKEAIERDSTLVHMWDIETYRTIQNGLVPTPADNDYTIFMMCSAFFWHHSDESMYTVCVVDEATNARKGMDVVVECGTEPNVLTAHAVIGGKMAPDIRGAFNGGNFDWPLYREKMYRENKLVFLKQNFSSLPISTRGKYADTEDQVLKWNFRAESIKIDAETKHELACVAGFAGVLDTDVLPVFLKLYPRAEVRKSASLNFFLAKNGLESKEDMPYKRMFKIYERAGKLKGVTKCHCDKPESMAACQCCKSVVPELDYVPMAAKTLAETEYTNQLHPDLVHADGPNAGKPKCCFCGKKPRNSADMAEVGYYCVIDCVRPQQLYVKRSIIPDKRALSNRSFVSLYDSFYRADGMKVRNLIGAYCYKYEVAFSNAKSDKADTDKDHYPGAWVFPPNRGLNNKRPITGLDFASLYPSLMMAYNLSPDMIVYTKEEAEKLAAEGYNIHHIAPFDFERGKKKGDSGNKHLTAEGWTVRHNGVFNPKKDKKIITKYTKYEIFEYTVAGETRKIKHLAGEPSEEQREHLAKLKAEGVKITRKVSYDPTYAREPLPGERMGINSYVVKKLFDARVPIKAEFVKLSKMKEQMEKDKVKTMKVKNPDGSEYELDYKKDICFRLNKVESDQKALKVLANTFYGESGNYKSSIYELLVAAGITCAGQLNIKDVAGFVTGKGFTVHYGDTDSLYLSCPDHVYEAVDKVFADACAANDKQLADKTIDEATHSKNFVTARLKYWTDMVSITMRVMNELKEQVADFLLSKNGTCFLNMAYEEVGFPTVLCGKKKYFLTPHIEIINFYPKEVFVRGIDIIKQGQTKLAKDLGDEFMRECLAPENTKDMMEIAKDKIRKIYETKWDTSKFVLSAKYKPGKKNVPVHTFVSRMKEMQQRFKDDPVMTALYEPPEPGDKFEFVIVKKDQRYSLQGSKIEIKKGDQMEFVRVYKASQNTPNPMEIDLDFYMESQFIGIFARFIAYHPDFQPPEGTYDPTDKEEYAEMDKFCVDKAFKYLQEFCYSITGYDKKALQKQGRDYRSVFTEVDKKLRYDLAAKCGSAGFVIHGIDLHDGDDMKGRSTKIVGQIVQIARETAGADNFGVEYVDHMVKYPGNVSLFTLRRIYNGDKGVNVARARAAMCDKREQQVVERLYQLAPEVSKITYKYERGLINLIDDMRKAKDEDGNIDLTEDEIDGVNDFADRELVVLKSVRDAFAELIAVNKIKLRVLDIVRAIEINRAKAIGGEFAPPMDPRAMARDEARKAVDIGEYSWT